MISPRATRLVRVPDLQSFRGALVRRALDAGTAARRTVVLVPTRGAAEELRRTIETAAWREGRRAILLPDLLTRAEFYARVHEARPDLPPLLTRPEREVLLRRAARQVVAAGIIPPFRLRAGIVVQMLDFYDELRRREGTLDDFVRHITARLVDSAETDRGAERLLRQTEFLAAALATFERDAAASGALDEHGLRAMLLDPSAPPNGACERVVITTLDQAGDPRGLYGCDFDLVSRLSGLVAIDVIATEAALAAGFHERIHALLPGIEEERCAIPASEPVLVAPETPAVDQYWFRLRDREEELATVVRLMKARARSPHERLHPPPLDRMGIAYGRPLPYLYLARQVFEDGGLPYEALDALPLSAEPLAATVDVLLSVLSSEANRTSLLELLSSPHFTFKEELGLGEIAALDKRLRESKYAGGWDRLAALPSTESRDRPRPGDRALATARALAERLQAVLAAPSASGQIHGLLAFIRDLEHLPDAAGESDPVVLERHLRARAAILSALELLRDAHARFDDERLDVPELAGGIRRWIDAQTFSPRTGRDGVRLLDAAAAVYADLDELHVIGMVEGDWPEPVSRTIFYPGWLLAPLGWTADAARTAAARARFQDLLASPRLRVSASTITLEDDAIVSPSPFLEELQAGGLTLERWPEPPAARVFLHEAMQAAERRDAALSAARAGLERERWRDLLPGSAAEWLALRTSRTSAADARFKGTTGARAPQVYAVSYLERYLECPFKYFAGRVLSLPEERDDEGGLTAIERGHLLHDVFETFFREWQAAGGGTITIENVAEALDLFERVAEAKIDALPEADRALERTHLLGSATASGLGERAFAFEIEQGGQVVERLLEHELEGEFTFTGSNGPRRIRLRAKADRLDLMADGTIRVIDYKLGRAPKAGRALQLPIYGVMAQQKLEGYRGRSWTMATAGYVAFKEKEPFMPLGGRTSAVSAAIADGQQRLIATVEAIERGEFPVQPDEPFRCQWCGYAGVCRKDYVGDE